AGRRRLGSDQAELAAGHASLLGEPGGSGAPAGRGARNGRRSARKPPWQEPRPALASWRGAVPDRLPPRGPAATLASQEEARAMIQLRKSSERGPPRHAWVESRRT